MIETIEICMNCGWSDDPKFSRYECPKCSCRMLSIVPKNDCDRLEPIRDDLPDAWKDIALSVLKLPITVRDEPPAVSGEIVE